EGAAPRFEAAFAGQRQTALVPLNGNDDAPLAKAFQCIVSDLASGCLWWTPANPSDPDCAVEERHYVSDGTTWSVALPRCDRARGSLPCWRFVDNPHCPAPGTSLQVDRGLEEPPRSAEVRAFCECAN